MNINWLQKATLTLEQELHPKPKPSTPNNFSKIQNAPRELIYHQPGFLLFRYQNQTQKPRARILITFALINRPYIVDIPGRSLVKKLTEAGYEVFLIEWTEPQHLASPPTLEDYALNFPNQALEFINQNKLKTILFGICQGALFSLMCALAKKSKIDGLVLSGIPFDYPNTDHPFVHLVKWLDLEKQNSLIWPGENLAWIFKSLKPLTLHYGKFIKIIDADRNSEAYQDFLRIEKWVHDIPPISGPAFKAFLQDFVCENKLAAGNYKLAGKNLDPKNLDIPLLNIITNEDTIVPPEASKTLRQFIPKEHYQELILNGGHLTPYISPRAQIQLIERLNHFLSNKTAG